MSRSAPRQGPVSTRSFARAGLWVCLAAGVVPAQDWSEFDAAYEAVLQGEREGLEVEALATRYGDALRAFLQRSANEDGYGARLLGAGYCAYRADRATMAVGLFDEAWEIGPSEALAEWRISARFRAGPARAAVDTALPLLDGAEELRVGVDRALLMHAGSAMQEADRRLRTGGEGGLAVFEALVRASDNQPWALANLALAYRHVGRVRDAERCYRQALDAAPLDIVVWNDLGLLFRATGRVPEAIQAFRKSYDNDPDPGMGPAITNLVQIAWWAPSADRPAPLAAAVAALQKRPEAAMLRRLTVEALIDRSNGPGADAVGR